MANAFCHEQTLRSEAIYMQEVERMYAVVKVWLYAWEEPDRVVSSLHRLSLFGLRMQRHLWSKLSLFLKLGVHGEAVQ